MNGPPFPFPYGVNEFTTLPWSFEEDVENNPRLGVEVIEFCEMKLDPERWESQLELLANSGLSVSSVQPVVRTPEPSAGEPRPPGLQDRVARYRESIERIAPYAENASFVSNTGPAPNGNMEAAIRQTISDLRELAVIGRDHGVRIALAPLNPISLNLETAIWTLWAGAADRERGGPGKRGHLS